MLRNSQKKDDNYVKNRIVIFGNGSEETDWE